MKAEKFDFVFENKDRWTNANSLPKKLYRGYAFDMRSKPCLVTDGKNWVDVAYFQLPNAADPEPYENEPGRWVLVGRDGYIVTIKYYKEIE